MGNIERLDGDMWTEKSAKVIFPILVWFAKQGKPVTYSNLDRIIVQHGFLHHVIAVMYGKPAGLIGNVLIELEEEFDMVIPPLNALVVNKSKGLPSKGVDWYLERYLKNSKKTFQYTLEDRQAIVEEIHEEIYSFDFWDKILETLELIPFKPSSFFELDNDDTVMHLSKGGWNNETESDEHKNLKKYIANNPDSLNLPFKRTDAEIEYMFPSSDKADIVFKSDKSWLSIEVKSRISNENDIQRGIFQAIKYKALLRAEQKALGLPPVAKSYLVVENELSNDLLNLANLLGVRVFKYRL